MFSDLIEGIAFVCMLALVFVLWRSRLTGFAFKILRLGARAPQPQDACGFSVDQGDLASEATCALTEQADGDFLDLFECFE
ncbi:MAG: hypothetical protein IMF08_16605 [Proteobacteria bacterium]|nr:hypothetical protein [Pseudomonadota bacterium]